MWGILLQINSVLWALAGIFLIYSLGAAIMTWSWKQFWLALLLFVFVSIVEVALAAISEP